MTTNPVFKAPPSKHFFDAFNFNLLTISVQPESGSGAQLPEGRLFSKINRVRAIKPDDLYTEEVQAELKNCQSHGCAIYFTINEGDGVPSDPEQGKLNCGRRTNIQTLKSLCIDTDNANSKLLLDKLIEIKFMPHAIVESSKGRYHFYFLINDTPATGNHVIQWEATQRKLASLVPNLDQTVFDINQVLRIPGFYNIKRDNFQCSITRLSSFPKYDLAEAYARLQAEEFNTIEKVISTNGNGHHKTYQPFVFPEQIQSLSAGERRTSITKYIEHVMENVLPLDVKDEDFWSVINSYIITYLSREDAPEFLPGGKRRQNIENYYRDQKAYRVAKNNSIQAAAVATQFDKIEEEQKISQAGLPDEFYLNFPGDLGMLTREIHAFSPKTSLELAFAGALTISGALKADSFRYQGAWPLLNGIVKASTGGGKSELKNVIQEVLFEAGFVGPYSQLIDFQNTVQSLHDKLYSAGGVGTTIVDEGGDYLQILNSPNAPGYAKALKKYFKEASTGRGKGTRLSPGGSMSYKTPAIKYGMLSIWIFIQPEYYDRSFTMADMSDGFLPRFFVFNGTSALDFISTYKDGNKPDFECSLDMKVWIGSLASLYHYSSASSLTPILETTEKELKEKTTKLKPADIKAAQRDAVYEARTEARAMSVKVQVQLTDEAQAAVVSYLKEQMTVASKVQNKSHEDPRLGIFVRMEEMLNRLLCNSASYDKRGLIDLKQAEACIQFHRYQTDRFFKKDLEELSKGTIERDMEHVVAGVARACLKEGGPATVRQINQCIAPNRRPKNLSSVLKELVNRSELFESERPHATHRTRKVKTYSVSPDEDLG